MIDEYNGNSHRILMSSYLGIPLKNGWIVHHIDGNKTNNSKDNLALLVSHKAHSKIHKNFSQSWYLTISETTKLTYLFKKIIRLYRLNKFYGRENEKIHIKNKYMELTLIIK